MSNPEAIIRFSSSLPDKLYPFHPDSKNKIPGYITNGLKGKVPFAKENGCPIIVNPMGNVVQGEAEDVFHQKNGDTILGPSFIEGLPYSLRLAREKLVADVGILGKDNQIESFFVTDSAYRIQISGYGVDCTIHKPKHPGDIEKLAKFMYEISLGGNALLSSVTGIARYDENTGEVELYGTETEMGTVRPFDMSLLINRLKHNTDISMGSSTYDAMDLFIGKRPDTVKTTVTRYTSGYIVEKPSIVNGKEVPRNELLEYISYHDVQPEEVGVIESSAENNLWLQRAGLGFIPR